MTIAHGKIASWREADRLRALLAYDVLDTPREKDFDDIAALAAAVCETPIAVVNLIGDQRQFFKAEVGLGVRETPIDSSFCVKAILEDDFLLVPDATADKRFDCNPLVTGAPELRFYAGALLKTADNFPIGTVCVLDYKPRALSEVQQQTLRVLARQVMKQLDLRKALREQAERALLHKASEERARLAQEAGRIGTFEVHIASGRMIVSDEMCRVFGLPVQPTCHAADFEALVLKDDRDVASSDETRKAGVAPLDVSYRVRRADDGRVRWVTRRSQIMTGADGKPERMFGAVYDSTDMRAGQALVGSL
ncbi:MAG TPA: PAS domain-containing protein, partial [Hyphomonadaceae bacterium]|nr:PAS domain-containing protein [Hyphomonadaceae bacterium]